MVTFWRRVSRAVGLVSVASFLIFALTPLANIIARGVVVAGKPQHADAIVVLGAGLMTDGSMTDESLRRFVQGISVFKEGVAPRLVFAGPPRNRPQTPSEAEVRSRFAQTLGIPQDAILQLPKPLTTRDEASHAAELLRPHDAKRIILVTESIHMWRAKPLFENAGFEVIPRSWDNQVETAVDPRDRLWLMYRLAQECTALVYYKLAGYL